MTKVSFEGNEYTLTQDAHCEVPMNAHYEWMAYAIDSIGNECVVCWSECNEFDGNDCGQACDWDNPIDVIYHT